MYHNNVDSLMETLSNMIQANGTYLLSPQSSVLHYRTEYSSVPIVYAIHMKESQGNMQLHSKYLWKFDSDHTSPYFTVRPINLPRKTVKNMESNRNRPLGLILDDEEDL
jgi:transglutaminase/protease-like cytokinesis protein 3